MSKLTYSEQLKHPNWQRKRLEMQEIAGWKCQMCDGDQKTLHVHHKEYFKGRMAWEYANDELQVLCEDCHSEQHDIQDLLKEVLAASTSPINSHFMALGLVSGFMTAGYDIETPLSDKARRASTTYFYIGALARMIALCPRAQIREIVASIDRTGGVDPVSQEVIDWLESLDA